MRKPTLKKPKTLDQNALLDYAGMALSARAQSLSELRTRLRRRAADPQDVEIVIAKLKENGIVDDTRFAASYVSWRRENQGLGKTRVLHDLMARRVAPAVAREAVDEAYKEVDEIALIETYLEKRYRGKDLGALLAEPKHLASAFRRLRTAGFSAGNSIKVLKRFAARAEELEDSPDSDD